MAIKGGESFERAIAYIMAAAGFVIREQPHDVKVGGETVGDFDILAFDPKSDMTIAVSCKEWKDQPPHSKDFNHMKELMDIEDIKYGVVAWTHIPAGVYPLIKLAEKKDYRFVVLDLNRYEELHNHMLAGERERIEEFFRSGLQLVPTKTPTLGQEIAMRGTPTQNRSLHCRNLLPMHYSLDPPSYLKNAYFKPHEARLLIIPYLHVVLDAHKEARIPGTGELADTIDTEVTAIYNATSGKEIQETEPAFQVIREHFGEAQKEGIIEEAGFIAEIREPSINKQEMTYRARVDGAKTLRPLEVRWTTRRGDQEYENSRTIQVTPSDLRERYSAIINVPIWNVTYKEGAYTYVREYFATTGSALRDDMASCPQCKKPTVAICSKCGLTACPDHIVECPTCERLFCHADSLSCANCRTTFCKADAKGAFCVTCGGFVCANDDARCVNCNSPVCGEHKITCEECGNVVCEPHSIERRYLGRKKKFCSEKCQSKYDGEYKTKGALGKLGSSIRSKKHEYGPPPCVTRPREKGNGILS